MVALGTRREARQSLPTAAPTIGSVSVEPNTGIFVLGRCRDFFHGLVLGLSRLNALPSNAHSATPAKKSLAHSSVASCSAHKASEPVILGNNGFDMQITTTPVFCTGTIQKHPSKPAALETHLRIKSV